MSQSPSLRASDQDRELLAAQLRDHYAAGRLSSDELSDRLDAVYASRTSDALRRLAEDLPDLRPPRLRDPARELARRRIYQDIGRVVLLNLFCVGIFLASGANGQFWPVWVILVSALRLGQDAWRLLGPGGRPELAVLNRRDRHRLDRRARRRLP